MNEKVDDVLNTGKETAKTVYDKGNELMDKVSFLQNGRNKKIVWGALGVIACLIIYSLFSGTSVSDIEDATKDMMREKGTIVKSVTLSKVGENKYHGLAQDAEDHDIMYTVDVTTKDDGTVMAEWSF